MCVWRGSYVFRVKTPEAARGTDSLELALQAVMNCPMMVADTEFWSSIRAVHALKHWAFSLAPNLLNLWKRQMSLSPDSSMYLIICKPE